MKIAETIKELITPGSKRSSKRVQMLAGMFVSLVGFSVTTGIIVAAFILGREIPNLGWYLGTCMGITIGAAVPMASSLLSGAEKLPEEGVQNGI